MLDKILILDFGSQTTQLIARRVRDLGVYCEVVPYRSIPEDFSGIKGVILSGSPYSIHDPRSFRIDVQALIDRGLPILAICYGAQLITGELGGT
ncbi:gamma-glutamyl-gamma-aminobutyrate hydrolase family protein, partial [uncultured Porphyromonas sp.]|uniref:glutamine amidotransferase-related protein n=1 Tax=uncultured Porphyromonas sp. TaxID=159274 RepID=UPI00345C4D91